jgi:hypothetical protein
MAPPVDAPKRSARLARRSVVESASTSGPTPRTVAGAPETGASPASMASAAVASARPQASRVAASPCAASMRPAVVRTQPGVAPMNDAVATPAAPTARTVPIAGADSAARLGPRTATWRAAPLAPSAPALTKAFAAPRPIPCTASGSTDASKAGQNARSGPSRRGRWIRFRWPVRCRLPSRRSSGSHGAPHRLGRRGPHQALAMVAHLPLPRRLT